jgi:(p)ppGpp synthase/HD superfamily hydrolase
LEGSKNRWLVYLFSWVRSRWAYKRDTNRNISDKDPEHYLAGRLGLKTLNEVRSRFGERVADIVAACSDSVTTDKATKAPWHERKEATVKKLRTANRDIALVTAADKLHNLSALVRDVRREGIVTMSRFNASLERVVWYHTAVGDALRSHRDNAPIDEMDEAIAQLAALVLQPAQ